jgi:hypothetical protein
MISLTKSRREGTPAESTAEQLKADIDSGLMRDKVNNPDPAAAPLGTDEEAAATPVGGKILSEVRKAERAAVQQRHDQSQRGLGLAWIIVAIVAACTIAIAIWMLV